MTSGVLLDLRVKLSCLHQVDRAHPLIALVPSIIHSAQLGQPVPIFGIPCIPPGHKTPIVFPCLAPKGNVAYLSLSYLFFLWKRDQIRIKSEEVYGVLLKRQCSKSWDLGGKSCMPYTKTLAQRSSPRGRQGLESDCRSVCPGLLSCKTGHS